MLALAGVAEGCTEDSAEDIVDIVAGIGGTEGIEVLRVGGGKSRRRCSETLGHLGAAVQARCHTGVRTVVGWEPHMGCKTVVGGDGT